MRSAYECTNSTVHIVNTPEAEFQDSRERGQLSTTYYPTLRDVPTTPSEVGTRVVEFNPYAGSKWIMAPPRVYIPPIPSFQPQPAYNPYAWPPQQHQSQYQGYGQPNPTINPYQPQPLQPNSIPSPYGAGTSSAYRPRSGAGAASPAPAPAPGTSSAYRPRATSAPAPTPSNDMKPEYERRASTPTGTGTGQGTSQQPKRYNHLNPSGNPDPIPDRQRINHVWKKEARPRKSALHNPLTPQELAESFAELNRAPPMDFSKFDLDDEDDGDDHDGLKSSSNAGPWRDMSRGPASKQ